MRIFFITGAFIIGALLISLLVSKSITTPLNRLVKSIKITDKDGIPWGPSPNWEQRRYRYSAPP